MSSRKFILESAQLGRYTLNDDPQGWDSVKKTFTRNLKYIGIFRKRTSNLKFVGDGLHYCVELYNIAGTEAVVTVVVMQKKDYEDAWQSEYEGIAKFNPFELEWDEDLAPTLSIEFEDSGFHNKFLTRVGIDINVGSTKSIEGVDMGEIPTESIQVHQRRIEETNTFTRYENYVYYAGAVVPSSPPDPFLSDDGHIIPLNKISGDTDFVKQPDSFLISPMEEASLIVDFTIVPVALTLKYKIVGSGHIYLSSTSTWLRFVVRVFNDKDDLTDFTDTLLHEVTLVPPLFDPFSFGFNFEGTLSVTLLAGQAMTILAHFELGGGGEGPHYEVTYSTCDITISLVQNYDEYISECHYRYEYMKRLIQLMTDQEDCFKSDVFGRTEIGYTTDGLYHNNVVFSGKQLRGFTDKPHATFDKTFKSVKAIWNMGLGIEKISNKFKVVIEELPYFFRGTISVTLHNVRKVKRTINEEFTFSEVKVGYLKSEYEEVNGLEEYNNKSNFASFIKSDTNVLDIVSEERADGYGMEFARRKNVRIAATEDTQYDNEIFTAMVLVDATVGLLRTEKAENYDSVENIASIETATNLDITPQRNLYRNGDWIRGCVLKYPAEKLKFVSADKPTDLESTRTGSVEVAEQTDVINGTLISPLWKNENYIFEADITPDQIAAIEKRPFSLIKFSPFSRETTQRYWYGWILDTAVGGKERNGTFTLLAANIGSDRLKIYDPEGIYNEDPTTPLPPEPQEYGFEYSFEKVFEG